MKRIIRQGEVVAASLLLGGGRKMNLVMANQPISGACFCWKPVLHRSTARKNPEEILHAISVPSNLCILLKDERETIRANVQRATRCC